VAAPAQGASLVFERRTPLWLVLLGLLAWPTSLVLTIAALILAFDPPGEVRALMNGVPGGALAFKGTLVAIALTSWTLGFVVGAFVDRCFGWCEVKGDLLRFSPSNAAFSPMSEVVLYRVTEHGVVLRRRDWGRFVSGVFPLLVPTRDDLEQRRALAALRALAADPAADDWRGSLAPGAPAWVRLCQVALPLSAALGVVVVGVRLRPGPDELKTCLFLFFALAFAGFTLFDWLVGRVHGHRLHAGREQLLLDGAKLPWADLGRVAVEGEHLVLEAAGRSHLVWLGASEERRARWVEVLTARLTPRRLEPALPAWAAAAPRRRRARLGLVAVLAPVSMIVALSLSSPDLPAETLVEDRLDNGARLVHRLGARGSARLLYLVADGPWRALDEEFFPHDRIEAGGLFGALGEEEATRSRDGRRLMRELRAKRGAAPAPERQASDDRPILDLATGEGKDPLGRPFSLPVGTTFVVLGERGVETAAAPLPDALLQALSGTGRHVGALHDLLEPALAPLAPDHPAVARWLRGETSRRHVEVQDGAGWTLAWGVDHGEVLFALVIAPGKTVTGTWSGSDVSPWRRRHAFHQQGPMSALVNLSALPFAVLDGSAAPGGPLPAPTLDALHEVTARVRAGASVPAALDALPPGWSAALGP
jgi:hypothetical protein